VNRYIFTVTAGRSGQNTFTDLIKNHVKHSYVAFEEPQIDYIFSGRIENIERRIRRNFFETHELLGRGKVLSSFVNSDIKYIEAVAKKRVNSINKVMKKNGDLIYIDISKYFARGLHLGFQEILPKFSLIHLVRDPILNMRSFLNRDKDFYLDNNSPKAKSNKLVMDSNKMVASDLYLWAWCEMALRYESIKKKKNIDRYVEIHTNKLNNHDYINQCLDKLNLEHVQVTRNDIRLNTNKESGFKKTRVGKTDINKFEEFFDKVPDSIKSQIPYLQSYDPYAIHKI
jgi:hypothetical protein